MNRRKVVRLGMSVGGIIVTGCLSEGGEADKFESTESSPVQQDSIVNIDNTYSRETTAMHRIIVENSGEEKREFTIQIEHDGEVVFDETDELASDTAVELTVDDTGTYTTVIEFQSSRNITRTTVSNTDCESRTVVSFSKDGMSSRNINRC